MSTENETSIKNILKSILNVRCREGATIKDIENDYMEMVGQSLPNIHQYLNSIECVYCLDKPGGEQKWFVNSDNTKHIAKMIYAQKIPILKTNPSQREQISQQEPILSQPEPILIKESDCFFKDNIAYKNMRKLKPYSNQRDENSNNSYRKSSPIKSLIPTNMKLHAQYMGDDFIRLLPKDLHNNEKNLDKKNGVQHNGLCISGLSIQAAAKLIELTPNIKSKRLIINVGSVDILNDRDLIEICSNFENLIKMCEKRGLEPIITTLAPLANMGHSRDIVAKLREFNEFITEKYFSTYEIIDIWSLMTNPRGVTKFEYFKSASSYVSGSYRPHVLWNNLGRATIRNHIYKSLSNILNISVVCLEIDA